MSSSLLVFTNPCIEHNSSNPLTSLQQIYISASQFLFWIGHNPVTSVPKATECGLITSLILFFFFFSFLFAVTGLGVGVVFSVLFFKRKCCFRRLNAGLLWIRPGFKMCPPPPHPPGRTWPVSFGSGLGLGMGYANCQHDFRSPYLIHGRMVKVRRAAGQCRVVCWCFGRSNTLCVFIYRTSNEQQRTRRTVREAPHPFLRCHFAAHVCPGSRMPALCL